jgi:hypothetical protein
MVAKAARCTENVAAVLGSYSECGRPMPCATHVTIADLRARLARAEHELKVLRSEMRPGRWWRVLDEDGGLWCESSDEQENRRALKQIIGGKLQQSWQTEIVLEWRDA